LTPLKRKHSWPSVRKVRHREQIYAILEFASEFNKKPFSSESFRDWLAKARIEREESRMRGSRRAMRSIANIRRRLDSLAEDNLSFARKVGLLSLEDGQVKASPLGQQALAYRGSNNLKSEGILLRLILDSGYNSYLAVLMRLNELGGRITIPTKGSQRKSGSQLEKELSQYGLDIDLASFFTIRDLFYDFGLLNVFYDMASRVETILLTCEIKSKGPCNDSYEALVQLSGVSICYWRKIPIVRFKKEITRAYLQATGKKWDQWYDILSIRDIVAKELRISDRQFNSLLLQLLDDAKGAFIRVTEGYTPKKVTYGYSIKSIQLPETTQGVLIRYIALIPERVAD